MLKENVFINKFISKYQKSFNALFSFLIIFSFICLFVLVYTYSNIHNYNKLGMEILDIKSISDNIDNSLGDDFSVSNLDDINQKSIELSNIVENIETNPQYRAFLSHKKINDSFNELISAIEAKKSALNQFITDKAVITEGILDLSSNLRYTQEIRTLAGFYSRLLLSRFGDIFDADLFGEDISKTRANMVQSSGAANIDYTFLQKLGSLNDKLQETAKTWQQSEQLNISGKAEKLIAVLDEYITDSSWLANVIIGVLAGIIALLFFRILLNSKNIYSLNVLTKQIEYILTRTNNSIMSIDENNYITSINNIKEQNKNSLIGKKIELYDENGHILDIISDLKLEGKEHEYKFSNRINEKNNNVFEKIFVMPNYNKYGYINGAELVLHDFSAEYEIKQKLDKLKVQFDENLNVDKETKLPNYAALHEALENNQKGFLLYIGVEQFENIQFFYNADTVLKLITEISKTINLCIDNFRAPAKLYRLQEDKFCILYLGEYPETLAKNILNYFKKPVIIDELEQDNVMVNIDLCFGISADETKQASKLTQAKLAYQKAKQIEEPIFAYDLKGNNELIYTQNQETSRLIRNAINNNGVIVECQPIFDLTRPTTEGNYEIFSYEILVRIRDNYGKIHYPGTFLDVAKQAGLYLSITKAVINHAFNLVEQFDYRFSVNLSSADMSNHGIRELFLEKMAHCSKVGNITIEVLETEDVERNMNEVTQFLADVRKANCHVAIDDFGSGYANIAMVLQLNIDYIKIDGSIVQRLTYDENSKQFLSMLTNLDNHTTGKKYTVVAEFVSNAEILNQVISLGVQYAQGFHLGKPIKLENLTA